LKVALPSPRAAGEFCQEIAFQVLRAILASIGAQRG
jgi:hypothetical protein